MVLDGLPGLYGLKYDSATACGLPLYLCSYKLVGSATARAINGAGEARDAQWPGATTACVDGVGALGHSSAKQM